MREYTVLHLFSGIGGAALGFQEAKAEYKGLLGTFETLAGVDCDPEACQDFENLTGAPAVQMDLFSRDDYIAFHGKVPPDDWVEVVPRDILEATGQVYPDVVFLSQPFQFECGRDMGYPRWRGGNPMRFNEYQKLAERTANRGPDDTAEKRFTNFAFGLAGETGEVIDCLKKHLFHGHPLDREKLKIELGDLLWYIATTATTAGIPLNEIAVANIEKLKARYPEGFSEERSRQREEGEDNGLFL